MKIKIERFISFFHSKKKMRVLFWETQPPTQSGCYFRSKKWCDYLNESNENIYATLWFDFHDPLFSYVIEKNTLRSFVYILVIYIRVILCFIAAFFNVIIIRREFILFNEFGGLFMDRFLYSLNPHLIYDFDDKIYDAKGEPRKLNLNTKYLQQQDSMKALNMLGFYKFFTPGGVVFPEENTLFKKIIEIQPKLPSSHIKIIPMCVDYEYIQKKVFLQLKKPIIIGWYGSAQNMDSLDIIIPALNALHGKYDFKLCVVSNNPLQKLCNFPVEFRKWSLETEIENLRYFDIGISPQNKIISEKSNAGSFKVIQYMGVGLVTVVSNINYNKYLIQNEINGFIVNDNEWSKVFEYLFNHPENFKIYGENAYKTVHKFHSFEVNFKQMISFLKFVNKEKN